MTHTVIALIVLATAAVTAAVCITCWHLHLRSYRRSLARVRAQRDAYKVEALELREERLANRRLSFADYADTATRIAVDEPIPYGLAPDPDAPAWTSGWLDDGGNHVHTEFGQIVRSGFDRGRS